MSNILNRVIDFRRVPASELVITGKNHRIHDEQQRNALETVLESIGFIGYVLAYQVEDELRVLDGHLRVEMSGDEPLPVLVTDLDEREADIVLATHDAIGDLADSDQATFEELVNGIDPETFELDELLHQFIESTETLDISGAGEQRKGCERLRFRTWRLPMTEETAELLDAKLTMYVDKHANHIGLGEKIVQAAQSVVSE